MTASVASLVRRANAGEVNARSELARIGRGAVPGYGMLARARAAVSRFGEALLPTADAPDWGAHPEDSKPPLPPGALDGLADVSTFAQTILKCCKYRDGSWACAILIASGPSINAAQVHKIASALRLSSTQGRCFTHAVRYPDDASCRKLAAGVGAPERCAIAVGQCVGRARMLQAARSASRMSGVHNVIAYEMGET